MSMEKTAAFLADCLGHMPWQPEQVQSVVDTAIAGLKRIANGQEWPKSDARAAGWAAADAAADAADWAAYDPAADAADWAANRAAYDPAYDAAARAASAAAYWAAWAAADAAADAADWAALVHPDPAKERARQAKVREKLGLNTEGA